MLSYELCSVPIALAHPDGTLRKTGKSTLIPLLEKDVSCLSFPIEEQRKLGCVSLWCLKSTSPWTFRPLTEGLPRWRIQGLVKNSVSYPRRPKISRSAFSNEIFSFWLVLITVIFATERNDLIFSFWIGSQKFLSLFFTLDEINLSILCLSNSVAPMNLSASASGRTTPEARLLRGIDLLSSWMSSGMWKESLRSILLKDSASFCTSFSGRANLGGPVSL